MQYITGTSLYNKLKEINSISKSWHDLTISESVQLLTYLIQIVIAISNLHKKGYVHRDIVPVNFLIDKSEKLFLIDLELTYSLRENKPSPPFTLGTPGFASPEQQAISRPTTKEDIYGLGALYCKFSQD